MRTNPPHWPHRSDSPLAADIRVRHEEVTVGRSADDGLMQAAPPLPGSKFTGRSEREFGHIPCTVIPL